MDIASIIIFSGYGPDKDILLLLLVSQRIHHAGTVKMSENLFYGWCNPVVCFWVNFRSLPLDFKKTSG